VCGASVKDLLAAIWRPIVAGVNTLLFVRLFSFYVQHKLHWSTRLIALGDAVIGIIVLGTSLYLSDRQVRRFVHGLVGANRKTKLIPVGTVDTILAEETAVEPAELVIPGSRL
jgi:hypothetical protein